MGWLTHRRGGLGGAGGMGGGQGGVAERTLASSGPVFTGSGGVIPCVEMAEGVVRFPPLVVASPRLSRLPRLSEGAVSHGIYMHTCVCVCVCVCVCLFVCVCV